MAFPNDCFKDDCCDDSQVVIVQPCPALPPHDLEITVETACPSRVNLPGASKARSVSQWIKALADQFCTLNPIGIRGSKPCQVLTTVPDPNGGSMVESRSVLDMLNCVPFQNAGEGFIYDGNNVVIKPLSVAIDKLVQLTDGPRAIVPNSFLVGASATTWDWRSGCLPPCPTSGGLVLQSTANGGMQWGPLSPLGVSCPAIQKALITCLPRQSQFPDRIIGLGSKDGDICNPVAASYSTCDVIRTGLKTCLTSKVGSPTEVIGFDADGNPFKYTLGSGLSCVNMKTTFPSVATRAAEVYGVGSDGTCNRFVRECDSDFRATARPAIDVSSGTRMIADWGVNSLYAVLSQDYSTGTCAGSYAVAATPGSNAFYTIKAAGRYAIEGSVWINVRFSPSGVGQIHSDAVWAVIGAIMVTTPSGATEYRLGESSDSIDYITDPTGAYTVNNCTKGLTAVGMDFFFSRTLILNLPVGATVSAPRARVNPVHNASDISATVTIKTDGETSLAVTKLASPSF